MVGYIKIAFAEVDLTLECLIRLQIEMIDRTHLMEGTHTVEGITARLAGLGAASSEVSPPLEMLFQSGLLDPEAAPA